MAEDISRCPAGHLANRYGQCGIRSCPHTYLGRHDGVGPSGPDQKDDDD